MDTEYDFNQTINSVQMLDEISTAGLSAPDYILTDGTIVQIFYVTPLTSDQQNTLQTVVANHVANPKYVTLAVQTQVATLVAYLNNTNTAISNAARSAIVATLASNMPLAQISAINRMISNSIGS